MRDIAEPRAIHRFSNQGGGVSPLVQLPSLLGKSTHSMGVVARGARRAAAGNGAGTSAGAVLRYLEVSCPTLTAIDTQED